MLRPDGTAPLLRAEPDGAHPSAEWPSVHEIARRNHKHVNSAIPTKNDRPAAARGRAVDGGDKDKLVFEMVESDYEECPNELEWLSDEEDNTTRQSPEQVQILNRRGYKTQGKRSHNFKIGFFGHQQRADGESSKSAALDR